MSENIVFNVVRDWLLREEELQSVCSDNSRPEVARSIAALSRQIDETGKFYVYGHLYSYYKVHICRRFWKSTRSLVRNLTNFIKTHNIPWHLRFKTCSRFVQQVLHAYQFDEEIKCSNKRFSNLRREFRVRECQVCGNICHWKFHKCRHTICGNCWFIVRRKCMKCNKMIDN